MDKGVVSIEENKLIITQKLIYLLIRILLN